jgi:hypothetical protein
MIEGDDDVVEAERDVGKAELVASREGQPLEVLRQLVAEVSCRAALERRQPGHGTEVRVLPQQRTQRREGIAGRDASVAFYAAVLGREHEEGLGRNVAVASLCRALQRAVQ